MCDSCPRSGCTTPPSSMRARTSSSRAGVPPQRRAETAGQERGRGIARALERGERGPDEQLEADERRDRVAGQPEDERRAADVENATGLPGFTATRQNTSTAPSSARSPRTRSCSPTDTPPEVSSTSAVEPALERGARRFRSSATDAVHLCLGAGPSHLRGEHHRVRLVDLAGAERLAGTAQLAAGREHGDARPPRARTSSSADRGERAELRRAARVPGRDDGVAGARCRRRADGRSRRLDLLDLDRAATLCACARPARPRRRRPGRPRRSRSRSPGRPRACRARRMPGRRLPDDASVPGVSAARTA